MSHRPRNRKLLPRFIALLVLALVLLLGSVAPAAAWQEFSFLALGDTRTEPYLAGGRDQAARMKQILRQRYRTEAQLFFTPDGSALERAEFQHKGARYTLYYQGGWPERIEVTKHGATRTIMHAAGRRWVFREMLNDIKPGAPLPEEGARFILHGGDLVLNGYLGTSPQSPYWGLLKKELLDRLPPADAALGLPGRVMVCVGNHETWEDPKLAGLLSTMPWLRELGFSEDNRICAVDYQNCRFIFLDTGGYSPLGTRWLGQYPPFKAQMAYLRRLLKDAVIQGLDHVVVLFHKPAFVKVGHDPLPADQNPHYLLKGFAPLIDILVISSHTHTTERYQVDGVNYLVLGAGGAPQKFKDCKHPSPQPELYWRGKPRVEEYNYLKIDVKGKEMVGWLHRWRPGGDKPHGQWVEFFRSRTP